MLKAFNASSRVMRFDIAHPTTRREYRSSTTARYNQPQRVQTSVMSAAYLQFSASAVKSRSSTLAATGW